MNNKNKISMEYEARVFINEQKYELIKRQYLNLGDICRVFVNKNTYFDTADLYLTNHHIVLRIREIDDSKKELTLKIKGEKGDIEITHPISSEIEYQNILNSHFDEEINKELINRNVDISNLKIVASLKTERIEIPFPDYLFVIDKNYYNDKIDFNLEVEANSRLEAKNYLKAIIAPFKIEYKKDYISKSRRAILRL